MSTVLEMVLEKDHRAIDESADESAKENKTKAEEGGIGALISSDGKLLAEQSSFVATVSETDIELAEVCKPESVVETAVVDYQKLEDKDKTEARQMATLYGGSPDTPHPLHTKTMKFTFKRGQRDRNAEELIKFAASLGLQCVSQEVTPAASKKNSVDLSADFRGHSRVSSVYGSFSGDSFKLNFVPMHKHLRKKTSFDVFAAFKLPEKDADAPALEGSAHAIQTEVTLGRSESGIASEPLRTATVTSQKF